VLISKVLKKCHQPWLLVYILVDCVINLVITNDIYKYFDNNAPKKALFEKCF